MKRIIFLSAVILLLGCSCFSKKEFKLCTLGLSRPYYYTGLSYKGGLYGIKKYFKKRYVPIKGYDATGIVKVKFEVNCVGETGNFSTETYSLSYKPSAFNKKIESQLLHLVKKLDDWIPGEDSKGDPINSFTFLSFRIEDGEILEIMPK